MTLRQKLALVFLPLLLVSLLSVGWWHYRVTAEGVERSVQLYLNTVIEGYVESELRRRYELLLTMGVSHIRSFNEQYQQEAISAANRIAEQQNGEFTLFDHDGRLRLVTGHLNEPGFTEQLKLPGTLDELSAESGIFSYSAGDGEKGLLFVSRPFEPWDWRVVFSMDSSAYRADLANIRDSTLLMAGILLVVTMALIYLFSQRILLRRIESLRQSAERIAAREPVDHIQVESNDELGNLARNMELMAGAIARTHEELEQRVEARTLELRESETRYRQLVEGTGVVAWEASIPFKGFEYVSPQAEALLGFPLSRWLEESFWPNHIHPDDRDWAGTFCADAARRGEDHRFEYRMIRADGEIIWLDDVVSVLTDETGSPLGMRGILIDISERKRAEQELKFTRRYLQNIIDSMPSILVGVTASGEVVQWNRQAEIISGIDAERALGQQLDKLLPLLAPHMGLISTAVAKQQPQHIQRMPHQIGDERRFCDLIVYPLGEEDDRAVVRVDDISDRVRMESMMVQTEKMMSVGGLAAGMAHELNNPLGGILQGVQNVQRRISPELRKNQEVAKQLGLDFTTLDEYFRQRQVTQFLETIVKSGERAAEIVRNMLMFARKPDASFSMVKLDELVDQALELASVDYDLKKRYDFRKIEIVREYQQNLPEVSCIPSEIQQVLLNLLRNAAQALNEEGRAERPSRITVRTLSGGQMACIEVEDNGPGMSDATSQRVFEPFFTTKPPGKGTGLGLSVSYFIVHDEHHGTLSVRSNPGMGTVFRLCLPLTPPERSL